MESQVSGVRQRDDRRSRSALKGAFLAYFVDMFDIYLPIVVLAPALAYFVPEGVSLATTSLVGGSMFAATLLGRPVGAAIFGHLADTIGRKRTTQIAVAGFGVCTLLLGLLPGHETLGAAALVLFIALRFVDGIFLGGEYTAANPLAMESAPKHRRGVYSALINCGFPLAYATVSLVATVLLWWLPSGDLLSPYVQWGWRIPFFLGAAMSFGLLAYYHFVVDESELWKDAPKSKAPIADLFRRGNLRGFLQVFVLMTGLWLALQTVAAILPGELTGTLGLAPTSVTTILVVTYLLLIPTSLGIGALSQRIGRRRCLILLAVLMLTAGFGTYLTLLTRDGGDVLVITLLVIVTVTIVDVPFALMPAYINERFSLSVRGSGYGLAYSLSVVAPSLYSFYQLALGRIMPAQYTVLVLLATGAILILVGSALGPETKNVSLGADH